MADTYFQKGKWNHDPAPEKHVGLLKPFKYLSLIKTPRFVRKFFQRNRFVRNYQRLLNPFKQRTNRLYGSLSIQQRYHSGFLIKSRFTGKESESPWKSLDLPLPVAATSLAPREMNVSRQKSVPSTMELSPGTIIPRKENDSLFKGGKLSPVPPKKPPAKPAVPPSHRLFSKVEEVGKKASEREPTPAREKPLPSKPSEVQREVDASQAQDVAQQLAETEKELPVSDSLPGDILETKKQAASPKEKLLEKEISHAPVRLRKRPKSLFPRGRKPQKAREISISTPQKKYERFSAKLKPAKESAPTFPISKPLAMREIPKTSQAEQEILENVVSAPKTPFVKEDAFRKQEISSLEPTPSPKAELPMDKRESQSPSREIPIVKLRELSRLVSQPREREHRIVREEFSTPKPAVDEKVEMPAVQSLRDDGVSSVRKLGKQVKEPMERGALSNVTIPRTHREQEQPSQGIEERAITPKVARKPTFLSSRPSTRKPRTTSDSAVSPLLLKRDISSFPLARRRKALPVQERSFRYPSQEKMEKEAPIPEEGTPILSATIVQRSVFPVDVPQVIKAFAPSKIIPSSVKKRSSTRLHFVHRIAPCHRMGRVEVGIRKTNEKGLDFPLPPSTGITQPEKENSAEEWKVSPYLPRGASVPRTKKTDLAMPVLRVKRGVASGGVVQRELDTPSIQTPELSAEEAKSLTSSTPPESLKVDLNDIARQVYPLLLRRIAMERERVEGWMKR